MLRENSDAIKWMESEQMDAAKLTMDTMADPIKLAQSDMTDEIKIGVERDGSDGWHTICVLRMEHDLRSVHHAVCRTPGQMAL